MRLPASICETPKAITSRRMLRRLAGRKDQAGVGNRQPQDGHQPLEILVADQMHRIELDALGRTQSGKADRVRADVVVFLQVQGVADQPEHLEPPVVQPEEGPDANVVALGLHGPGDAVEPPEIVALPRAGRVDAPYVAWW